MLGERHTTITERAAVLKGLYGACHIAPLQTSRNRIKGTCSALVLRCTAPTSQVCIHSGEAMAHVVAQKRGLAPQKRMGPRRWKL